MPPAARDYLDPDVPVGMLRRSDSELNSSYDMGTDPYTGKIINSSIATGRSNARMMEGLIPSYAVGGFGSVRPQDQGRAVALRNGSGSPYDDPIAGGAHYQVPRSLSGDVFGGRISAPDMKKFLAPKREAHRDELLGAAHDAEMSSRKQLGTYQSMSEQAGPELTQFFNTLPSNQQADLLTKPSADIVAALRNHPLRKKPAAPAAPAAPAPTMFPTITPQGTGGERPQADLDTSDYFELAGSES